MFVFYDVAISTRVLCKECSLFPFKFLAQFSATASSFVGIVPTGDITTKIEDFSCPWPWAYFLNGPNAAASTEPTHLNAAPAT